MSKYDIYLYENSTVLKNLLNIKNYLKIYMNGQENLEL